MKTKEKMMTVIALIFVFSGCSWLDIPYNFNDLVPGASPNVIGKWKFKDPSAGPHTLTFQKDHAYTVDLNGDSAKDLWGRYEIYLDKVKFTDEGGQIGSTCHDSGYYRYKIQGNEVRFEFLGDQCSERIKALSAAWVRASKKK